MNGSFPASQSGPSIRLVDQAPLPNEQLEQSPVAEKGCLAITPPVDDDEVSGVLINKADLHK
jgi:hypothetical protein